MKKLLTFALAICSFAISNGQVQFDSIQVERISQTSQLWGHLKFFHPYLDKNTSTWDRAYTETIDEVIKAGSKEEFRDALQNMLSVLNDPITRVVKVPGEIEDIDTIKYPLISYLKDSVLLVSIRDYRDLEDIRYCYDQFLSLREKIPASSGVIFDIRNHFELTDEYKGWMSYYLPFCEPALSGQTIEIPGFRSRFHDGFVPEDGSTSGGYASGFYVKGMKQIEPLSKGSNQKVVFIVNRFSEVPVSALALQQTGQGFILSTDSLSDESMVNTVSYELEDSVQVMLRLNELAIDYNVTADSILPDAKEEGSKLFEIALEFLNGNIQSGRTDIKKAEQTIQLSEALATNAPGPIYYPDLGNRLLAAAKIWTVIDYFFAYKELMEDDWKEVLKEFIPRFANAKDSLEYNLAVAEMYTHIEDGHGYIRSEVLSNYFGTAAPPIRIRFIEDQPVVVSVFPDSVYSVEGIEVGDIITQLNGASIQEVVERKMKYRSASNHAALQNYISRIILNGDDSTTVSITVSNHSKTETVQVPRYNRFSQYARQLGNGRNQKPILKLLNEQIGYADLDRLTTDMVDKMFADFTDTRAIIFDMRGYPNGTAWTIAPHLTNKKLVYAANFRRYSPMSMKVGDYFTDNLTIFNQPIPAPRAPYYAGITVMLIDERTQSQAEHTGLFFEAANGTKFIGSQTAGANGDVTRFQIPGNITLLFSGHDVRHFDGRQLQKVGLVPDIEVKPTIEGIRAGEDEVLEKAIKYVNSMLKE